MSEQANSSPSDQQDAAEAGSHRKWTGRWLPAVIRRLSRPRLPSFWSASLAAVLIVLIHVAWIYLAPRYHGMLDLAQTLVGLKPSEIDDPEVLQVLWGMALRSVRDGTELGHALLIFAGLALVAMMSWLAMLVQFARKTTLQRLFVIMFVVCAWLALWTQYGELHFSAATRQARRALPRFKMVEESLSKNGLTESEGFASIGTYEIAAPTPLTSAFVVLSREFPRWEEDIGFTIERTKKNGLRFSLAHATDCLIEFHPQGGAPESHAGLFGGQRVLREFVALEDGWFFARYDYVGAAR